MTKIISLSAFLLAVALIVLGGCVPSEEDFIADHPVPTTSGSAGTTASPNGSSLACESSISGSGTSSSPGQLGTAPKCFEFTSSTDTYYSVTIPTTGTWYFQIIGIVTGDMDIYVYSGVTFASSTLICSSIRTGLSDDICILSVGSADVSGTFGVRVAHFSGGTNFYRLEVVQ